VAEQQVTPNVEGNTQQTAPMEPSGGGNQPKTFTQEQVDRIVQERLARAKSTPPADYEDLKAKAAKYDELEEAQKSDLQKANDATARAQAEAADWKAKFEQAQAERERAALVTKMAAQYQVNAGTLARMAGDVEDNAKYLQGVESSRQKFGDVRDGGEQNVPDQSLDEALKGVKSTSERIRIRAEYNARNRK